MPKQYEAASWTCHAACKAGRHVHPRYQLDTAVPDTHTPHAHATQALRASDANGKSDPYIKIEVTNGDEEVKLR